MNDYSEFLLPLDENGIPIDPPPPTANQVMEYARAIQATPEIFAIFERMGDWGLPTNEEFDRLEEFRNGWFKVQGMDELNLNGFFGAYMLLRKIRWGQIEGLGAAEAMQFLIGDEPRNKINRARAPGGGGITTVPMRVEEIMWLANYIQHRCGFWPVLADDLLHRGDPERDYIGYTSLMQFYQRYYAPTYGLANRGRSLAVQAGTGVLEEIVNKRLVSLEEKQAWEFAIKNEYGNHKTLKDYMNV